MARIKVTEEYTVPKSAVAKITEEFLEWIEEEWGSDWGEKMVEPGASYYDLALQFAGVMESRARP